MVSGGTVETAIPDNVEEHKNSVSEDAEEETLQGTEDKEDASLDTHHHQEQHSTIPVRKVETAIPDNVEEHKNSVSEDPEEETLQGTEDGGGTSLDTHHHQEQHSTILGRAVEAAIPDNGVKTAGKMQNPGLVEIEHNSTVSDYPEEEMQQGRRYGTDRSLDVLHHQEQHSAIPVHTAETYITDNVMETAGRKPKPGPVEDEHKTGDSDYPEEEMLEGTEDRADTSLDSHHHHHHHHQKQHSTIPGRIVETAKKMQKAGIPEDELGTAEHPRLSFWDFGGQATYYGSHQCFITHRGIYILIMSLLQKLSDPVPDLDHMASVDNLRTGGDYLDHWLNSIRSHTLQHDRGQPQDTGLHKEPPDTGPPLDTEQPPVTGPPLDTEQPPDTEKPSDTGQPQQSPDTGQHPVTVQPPDTWQPPDTGQPPPTGQSPLTRQPLVSGQPPATEQPTETGQHEATEQPPGTFSSCLCCISCLYPMWTTGQSRFTEQPQATGQPPVTEQPTVTRQPPVMIVLTHKDMVSKQYIETYKQEIWSHIRGKASGQLVMPEIFAVDNIAEDDTVEEIRNYVRQVAKSLPHMGEEIPISWLHLNSRLRGKREEGNQFCRFQEVLELARDPDINITDKNELALVLTFLHDRGDIIFIDEPSLRDDVTLQPQVMIDVFKTIITVPEYQQDRQTDPAVRKMWERLEQEGVLSDKLLTRIWEKKDQQLENPFLLRHKSFLKALMEKFYLICNATPVSDASDEAQQEEIYFVPALLSCERDNAKLYPGNMHVCPKALYFVFSEKFLPSGMFCRLQALCVRRFGLKESRVFAGCALFPTDKEQQTFVVTKVNHYLKVELLASSDVFTEGLRVRKFLSSALFEIKEKWIPCIQYKLCCSSQQEDRDEPVFQALETSDEPVEEDSGIPSAFRDVWMTGSSQSRRTENSGGDGPTILQPTGDPRNMRTIGPVLDTMELGRGLSLDQCDRTRSQLMPKERVLQLVRLVENRSLLGAAVEMCCPEFADCFLREKRGKELIILHTDDYTEEFVSPLQTAASGSGVSYHTENIGPTVSITERAVELLLNTNTRMVALVISPQALHHRHWSNLDYEFPVRNKKLLLPILLYPKGCRDRMVRVLQQRAPVLCSLTPVEIEMEGRPVSEERLQGIVQKVKSDEERDFYQILESIFSRLDERDVQVLLRVWSARTGQQDSQEVKTPADLMKGMVKTGYITTGDHLGMLEKDMMAAGISLPAIVRGIPGVPEELKYTRTAEAIVGPMGGEVEIPGFVEVFVPPMVLERDTTVTISTVDVAAILRDEEGANWTSGYPWSLGEDVCPRELLDQVLFSPAVDVNLHGAELNGPIEVQTWRPPGSKGMTCLLLKHHDGEGWTDITASTVHHIYPDTIYIDQQTFSPLNILWVPVGALIIGKVMIEVLSSRTLDCRFAGYIQPHEEGVEFHVVCRDQRVKTDEYQPGFTMCGSNKAMSSLYHGTMVEVTVSKFPEGHEKSKHMELRVQHCCKDEGQSVQMLLDRSNGKPVKGEVTISNIQEKSPRPVCEFSFWQKGDILTRDDVVGRTTNRSIQERSSVDPSLPTMPVRRGTTTETVDVEESFEQVVAEVSSRWDELARKLEFNRNEIKVLLSSEPDADHRCWEMLHRWRNREGREATLQVLKHALVDIGERLTAESL